jgi:hypothetical protein
MSFANVALYIAILGFIVYRRVQGKPAGSAKQLFVLPVLLCVLGYQDLAHHSLDTIDVAFSVIGCGLSLLLGALRGSLDKLFTRDGAAWMRWGAASVTVFGINVALKLILDVISVAAGGTTSGATSSLLLAAGLMLGGEAAVVWLRLQTGRAHTMGSRAATPHLTPASMPAGSFVREEASRLAEGLLRRLADRRTQD